MFSKFSKSDFKGTEVPTYADFMQNNHFMLISSFP